MKLGQPKDSGLLGTFGSRLGAALLAPALAFSTVSAPAFAEAGLELVEDRPIAMVEDVAPDAADAGLEQVDADRADALAHLAQDDATKAPYGGNVTASLASATQVKVTGHTGYSQGRGANAKKFDAMANPKVTITCGDSVYASDAIIADDGTVAISGNIVVGTYTVAISSDNYEDKTVTFAYPATSTVEIGGATYEYVDATTAFALVSDEAKSQALATYTQAGSTSIYYKVAEGSTALSGTLYGMDMTTSTNYSELYNKLITDGDAKADDYDAISSATGFVNNPHYGQLSTLVARDIAGNEGDDLLKNKLTGAYATTATVTDAAAYVEASILKAAGQELTADQAALLNVRLNGNASVDPAMVTDRVAVDTETTSGFVTGYSYFDPTALSGAKAYGHLKLVIRPTAGDNTTGGTPFSWADYYASVYAGVISDGTTTVGMAPWIDLYTEAGHSAVEMSISNGTNPYNTSNQATVNRYAAFYDEASGRLKAGDYTVTIYAAGYNPLTYTFHIAAAVPTTDLKSVVFQGVDAASLEGKTATVTAYGVNEGEGNAAVEGEAYATDAVIANGTVALDKQLVPGDYKVVAGDFTYTFTVSEKAVSNLDLANATLEVGKASYAFTGKALKPAVTVTSAMGATLVAGTDYTVSYASNTNVGKATVTITGAGAYTGTKSATFTITRVANPISATVKTPKKLTFATKKQVIANPLKVTKAQGSVTYAKVSGKAYFTVNKATGKITVAKSTPAGTYVVKVKATAAGGTNYKAGSVTKSFKVTVSKAANSLAVKAVKATQAATYDKNTTIAAAKAFKVTKNVSKGKVTYAKTKGNAKIVVATNGKMDVQGREGRSQARLERGRQQALFGLGDRWTHAGWGDVRRRALPSEEGACVGDVTGRHRRRERCDVFVKCAGKGLRGRAQEVCRSCGWHVRGASAGQ